MLQSRHKAMAVVVLLVLVSLLDSVEGADRFVRSGSNLQLEAKTTELGENEDFIWKFNSTVNLVKFRHGSKSFIKYTERTVFSEQNYSLLLRNMQHSDTGNYKETISGGEDKTVAEYAIRVQDPVSPVKLTVTPIKSSFCNFTVTCGTVDSQISGSYQCESKTCRLLDQTHLKDSSLKVYVEESSIICNHSNQVSWEQDVKNVSSLCENPTVLNTATIAGITAAVLLLMVVSVMRSVLIVCKRKRSANTVYEVPQEIPQQNQYANPAEITECPSPTSTYALVQFSNPPVQINVSSTSTNQQPETIYAQVDRAAKSNSKPAAASR